MNDPGEIIRQLKDTNPEILSSLYSAYGRKIYNLAYRMTGNVEDAEDITQETFWQVYRKAGSFRQQSQLYTWIYAIAKNLCYQYYLRTKKNSFTAFEALICDAADTQQPPGIDALEKDELIQQVKEGCLTGLLRCLSFNQRIAFIFERFIAPPS